MGWTFRSREPSVRAPVNLQDPAAVREALRAGAGACRGAAGRRGSIDVMEPPGTLIATGDLHDNPLHFARLLRAAGFTQDSGPQDSGLSPTHLLLHELIHSERLVGGMDFSYRALVRVAALKAEFPERIHIVLANHELSQMM